MSDTNDKKWFEKLRVNSQEIEILIVACILAALFNIPDGNAEFIKSQGGYADYYSGFGWFGTLDDMNPHLGYLLRMSQDTEFVYSEGSLARLSAVSDISYDEYDLDIHDYEHNATMTSALYIDDARVDSYDYILSAHNGTNCVGYTEGLYFPLDGNIIFPLMVYSNELVENNIQYQQNQSNYFSSSFAESFFCFFFKKSFFHSAYA